LGRSARLCWVVAGAGLFVPDTATLTNFSEGTNAFASNGIPFIDSNAELSFYAAGFITGALFLVPEGSFRALLRLTDAVASRLVLSVSLRTPLLVALAVAGLFAPVAGSSVAGSENLFVALAATEGISNPVVELCITSTIVCALASACISVVES
jgi:hypothetical protein